MPLSLRSRLESSFPCCFPQPVPSGLARTLNVTFPNVKKCLPTGDCRRGRPVVLLAERGAQLGDLSAQLLELALELPETIVGVGRDHRIRLRF